MKLLSKLFGRRAKDEAIRRELIKKLDGRAIKYVVERLPKSGGASDDSVEEIVIGRSGALIVKDGVLIVFADGKVLFRAATDELQASELMSHEGVILTAPDIEHGGKLRTVVAYYTYFMK